MAGNWLTSVNMMSNECAKFDQVIWGEKIIINTANCIISQNVAAFLQPITWSSSDHPCT